MSGLLRKVNVLHRNLVTKSEKLRYFAREGSEL